MFTKRYPEGPLCEDCEAATVKLALGQTKPCDGEEEGGVVVVGDHGEQVDVEEAGHAVLALAPVVEALVRGQPKQLITREKSIWNLVYL